MGGIVAIVAILAVFGLVLFKMIITYLITSEKLKNENSLERAENQKLQQQIFYTMEEQEDMRERLQLLEKVLRQRGEPIPEYSAEAIRLEDNKKNLK